MLKILNGLKKTNLLSPYDPQVADCNSQDRTGRKRGQGQDPNGHLCLWRGAGGSGRQRCVCTGQRETALSCWAARRENMPSSVTLQRAKGDENECFGVLELVIETSVVTFKISVSVQ